MIDQVLTDSGTDQQVGVKKWGRLPIPGSPLRCETGSTVNGALVSSSQYR